ncbi:MAG: peptidoglycan DD-metalloendopeptidase family protein [Solirubrobacterales bacterium]|nr:peptidoglycan DD-metalloendopeptidase family protein [Solirubrobacterales bacterium]
MSPGATRTRTRTTTTRSIGLVAFAAVAALLSWAGAASGDGGIGTPDPPRVKDIVCSDRCLDIRTVTETGKVEVTGRDLGETTAVRFPGAAGRIDVKPSKVESGRVTAKVPTGAASGKVIVESRYGTKAKAPEDLVVKPEDAIRSVKGFAVKRVEAAPKTAYFDGRKDIELDYLFEADEPADIRIDIVAKKKNKTVDSIIEKNVEPFSNQTATWDGLDAKGKPPRNGKYKFRVSALGGESGSSQATGFAYYDHIFPLRGKHYYGDGLGAGRGHQGQDVFARCGTKIVAARGGTVQTNAYQSAAGYYVVIDGKKTGEDYVYMHMEKKGRPKEGSRVRTGETIGRESDTGDATGCHLHFELWSAPGWYEGGHVLNPTRPLKKWDKWS